MPIGTNSVVQPLGVQSAQIDIPASYYVPYNPLYLSAGTYSTGSVNTASTETTGTQTFSTFARITTAQLYVNPLYVNDDFVYRVVDIPVSANTVAGTGSVSGGWMMGLYKISTTYSRGSANTANTGQVVDYSSNTVLTALSRWQFNFIVNQNSVTAQSYTLWSGTVLGNSTANSTSTGGNLSTDFTGEQKVALTTGATSATSSLSQGQYFVIHGFTKTSGNANVFSAAHGLFAGPAPYRYIGSTGYPISASVYGSFTTRVSDSDPSGTSGTANVPQFKCCLPDSMALSLISASAPADVKWMVPIFHNP